MTLAHQHPIPPSPMPEALRLLGDETRWRLIGELRWSDRQVGELCERLDLPQNLVSYHLGVLRQAGLVRAHRSDADGRVLYYALDLAALQRQIQSISSALALPTRAAPPSSMDGPVLFICTRNSARSQIAEAWLRHLSGGRIITRSAGTAPASVQPLAIQVMAEAGIDIGYQRAKRIADVIEPAPAVVVTVCDLAREECSATLDAPLCLHWSIPDPVAVSGSESERLAAFRAARDELRLRVEGLLGLLPTISINPN
ncbi:metalloregulator ArsR/SmtB family transcription factor [Roseiflexus castenholzii]|uniref:Transcriptional regulator, ArsR family n=1 Tax=Roseiflexus castenholzii (strain DSM 13941 / HLO8) TaxID=383372 RepID=A7NLK8_ROSCS|nr:metalloregulator ArsR/SmtB family transcription factor [Roseiflexus castenholzii]ABU58399.1 transcriptional regulator, ArsR family [Roseiflexus castenholzii DSM 13941]